MYKGPNYHTELVELQSGVEYSLQIRQVTEIEAGPFSAQMIFSLPPESVLNESQPGKLRLG